jgi:ribosomal-protein-alanine N-acetyltransferase
VFLRAATLALDVVFSEIGVHRLEARSVDANSAANMALHRLGARPEGVLHAGFRKDGIVRDHMMWSILAPAWKIHRERARHDK